MTRADLLRLPHEIADDDKRAADDLKLITRRAIAQFIAAHRDHAWIARQCDVSIAAVRGVDRALRMVRS